MGMHTDYVLTTPLREAYSFLLGQGELDPVWDVREKGPSPKRSVNYNYAGRSSNPFSFIVNSGERKSYHLFYIRHAKPGHRVQAEKIFGPNAVNANASGEITIQIKDRSDAEMVFTLMHTLRADRVQKICPLCGHHFQGNGWDGIDAHWRARHEDECSYEVAWQIICGIESQIA